MYFTNDDYGSFLTYMQVALALPGLQTSLLEILVPCTQSEALSFFVRHQSIVALTSAYRDLGDSSGRDSAPCMISVSLNVLSNLG